MCLNAQLIAAVEDSVPANAFVGVPEQPGRNDRPETIDAMHGEGVDDVVDLRIAQLHESNDISVRATRLK